MREGLVSRFTHMAHKGAVRNYAMTLATARITAHVGVPELGIFSTVHAILVLFDLANFR